ncbi:hypothetical protein DFQ10_10828 [Winogradskyella eximia]|jgi:hypothetical protein|uniref:Carbohydrate binding protein with CBM6 domain n=1 Tax=Winogradskyella eximia TaxID=262006 RepID=A0A3D9H0E8_9FLAO|nr:hypothetical protein [Winogradskyella eximia]RED42621.1 hypothetical protein DFQ10_10828 [Winogradskyella eximia]
MIKKILLFAPLFFFVCHINTAQNVGIDEPDPSEKLDVNGRVKAKGFKFTTYNVGGFASDAPIFSAVNNNQWHDMPGITRTFSLDEATTVISSYTFSGYTPAGSGYIIVRLVIDGVVGNSIISGYTTYSGLHCQQFSELSAGSHTIKVQYRTNSPFRTEIGDYMANYLQILVFGSN